MFHISLHFIVPAIVVLLFYCNKRRNKWLSSYLIMIATMLVDLDHLLANPVYDPMRCSIGFHPLHSFIPITIYALLCLPEKTRLLGIGLIIHMLLDSIDCQITNHVWYV